MSQMPPIPDSIPPTMSNFGGPTDLSGEPKSWPKTIGIISIVWGSLGLICNGCGLLGNLATPMIQQMAASNPQLAQQLQSQPKPSVIQMGIAAIGILTSIFLIVAGSMLISRKAVAAIMHIAWSAVTIVLVIGNTLASIGPIQQQMQAMQAQMQAASSGGAAPPPGAAAGMQYGMYGMLGCTALISLAYPIFCFVWFAVIKRGTAEITQAPEARAA